MFILCALIIAFVLCFAALGFSIGFKASDFFDGGTLGFLAYFFIVILWFGLTAQLCYWAATYLQLFNTKL